MTGAGIYPGDILVVDRALEPVHGRIVIAVVNDELIVQVAGYRGQTTWRVTERIWPFHWVIESQGNPGGYATITYTLTSQGEGTRFQRELMYRMPDRWLSLLNWLVLRHRIARESVDALRNVKQVMERHQHETASPKSAQIR
jgi:hypothetical protein